MSSRPIRSLLPRGRRPSGRPHSIAPTLFALLIAASLAATLAAPAAARSSAQPSVDPALLAGLEARSIGPAAMSGRVVSLAGLPARPEGRTAGPRTLYVGAASGGLWRSVDDGATWKPLFDDQPAASIGAIAIDPTAPDVLWVGTGEPTPRNSASVGNGVYRSMDGGETWSALGLEKTERIARIVIDPRFPDTAYVCAMGTTWGESPDRGRVQDHRRRHDLAEGAVPQRDHRLRRAAHGPDEPEQALRRHVAAPPLAVDLHVRRPRLRPLRHPRRRRHLDRADPRGRAPRAAARPHRRGDRAVRPGAGSTPWSRPRRTPSTPRTTAGRASAGFRATR